MRLNPRGIEKQRPLAEGAAGSVPLKPTSLVPRAKSLPMRGLRAMCRPMRAVSLGRRAVRRYLWTCQAGVPNIQVFELI